MIKYAKLNLAMVNQNITIYDIAKVLDCKPQIIERKLKGEAMLRLWEMVAIKKLLKDAITIEEIFLER